MRTNFHEIAGIAALGACLTLAACSEEEGCFEQSGYACLWAGTGELAFTGDGQFREYTALYWPVDVAFGPDGAGWILDWNNHALRKVDLDGSVRTVVGDGFVGDGPPGQDDLEPPGVPGRTVSLNHPTDVTFLPDGTLIFAAWHNHKIRVLDTETELSYVLAGRGPGFAGEDGPMESALFNQPSSVVADSAGTLYVLDQRNHRVRRIAGGVIDTCAGTGEPGFAGDGAGATDAQLQFEAGSNPEPSGSLALAGDDVLFVADSRNHRIRRIDLATGLIDTVAGTGEAGAGGDGGAATSAELNDPRDIEIGPDGRLYVADTENHRIRVIDLTTGVIDTFAGTGQPGTAAQGLPKEEVELDRPFGIGFDAEGSLYIADTHNSRILKVRR
jgi:DNA-binding beta-propeller fold protein YncE